MRRYVSFGFLTILALFGGIGGWAATTDLAGAVIAPGSVVVAGNIKKVQHPTGGVVSQILVKNGDSVKAGDVVVRLDETVTRASLQLVTKQIDELIGPARRDSRLNATTRLRHLSRRNSSTRVHEPDVAQILNRRAERYLKAASKPA